MNKTAQASRKRELLWFIVRLMVIWGIEAVGLLFMAWLLPGVRVDSLLTSVVAVAAIGVVNALLWPMLSYLVLPFAVLTLGLLSLVLNALLVASRNFDDPGVLVMILVGALLMLVGLMVVAGELGKRSASRSRGT